MKEAGHIVPNQYRQYLDTELVPVGADEVPVAAADFFVWASGKLTQSPELDIRQFDKLFRLDRDDGVNTLFAVHDKYYDHIETTDRAVYLVDLLPNGEKLGHGELFYQLDNDEAEPIVMMSKTEDEYIRRGYGTNRLLAMN